MSDTDLILVTGGTGLVGSVLLRQLVGLGRRVRATRRPDSWMDLVLDIADRIEWVEADITDIVALEEAFEGVTHVIHAAALISLQTRDAHRMEQVNAGGTANIVNLSLDFGVRRLIYVSSVAAIGRTKLQPIADEKSPWERSSSNTNYANSKYLAEQEVWRGHAEGLPVVVVNPSMILGCGLWGQGSTGTFFKEVDRGLKFLPAGYSGFVDVRDVVRFIMHLLESDIDGERYILNARNLSYRELFQLVARSIGKKPPFITVTPLMAETGWRLEVIKERLFGIAPVWTKEIARSSMLSYQFSNDKSRSVFGFTYMPVEQSIADMAEQFLKNKKQAGVRG
jgi:nucleoside-diphosphate-sugar epimerase